MKLESTKKAFTFYELLSFERTVLISSSSMELLYIMVALGSSDIVMLLLNQTNSL